MKLTARYFSCGRKATGERLVSPQRLVHYRNTWYLDAWCHAASDLRKYAPDAVERAETMDEACKEVAIGRLEAAFDQSHGIITGQTIQWSTILNWPNGSRGRRGTRGRKESCFLTGATGCRSRTGHCRN